MTGFRWTGRAGLLLSNWFVLLWLDGNRSEIGDWRTRAGRVRNGWRGTVEPRDAELSGWAKSSDSLCESGLGDNRHRLAGEWTALGVG